MAVTISAKNAQRSRSYGPLLVAAAFFVVPLMSTTQASAQSMGYPTQQQSAAYGANEAFAPSDGSGELDDRLRRAVVDYDTTQPPGTIVIDTGHTALYYVLGQGRAIRYGVGVGREGFTWSGVQTITRKAEWPDWRPPAEMIARQPYLPRFMAGGPGNPLGARAMYLGNSEYRIHGTNDPSTIGKFVSSGCIRLTNADVEDLFSRVQVGAKVVVLPKSASHLEARRSVATRHAMAQPASGRAGQVERQAMNLSGSEIY
ncbi:MULTISPECIES: L,D-transpeptidase [Rhodopseudomonas]|uniref:L,D-TPase catalytic domain-containing protein n=1 Tax=Rhodopseudomonas palustris TaxID=1076 RepID=A0A0D7EWL3_RHOPL|nr:MULTISPECIES: L,D-transpeptidase [Rhodopseudomonas]KIZ44945.1 hypothetical protein OO17_08850 [Rhodopseudomonas palustris]MDF3812246.1 L,D-transpeptidase [Rhodopseudomonas sp. BAL398]WOK15420.1 L,D-transpeptidase [Rhodopseudomonas sp. BAL398]